MPNLRAVFNCCLVVVGSAELTQIDAVAPLLSSLVNGTTTWADAQARFPKFEQQDV
jgi:hypothetical protein